MLIKKKPLTTSCEGRSIYTDEHCLYTWGAELEEFQLEHIL